MSKEFDATSKHLLGLRPGDWLAHLGVPATGARLIDADLATVTAEADRVIRADGPEGPFLTHIELRAGHDATMAERLLRYNVLLRYRYRLPVLSAVVLLRREADGPGLTGLLEYGRAGDKGGGGPPALTFRYDVERVWRRDPFRLLAEGGTGVLPLVPLAAREADLPALIRRMEERIGAENLSDADAGILWTSTYVLMGLKFDDQLALRLLREVRGMEESATYRAIVALGEARGEARGEERGRLREARELLLRQGERRFGEPDARVQQTLDAITDRERLEELSLRLLAVESWDELLA